MPAIPIADSSAPIVVGARQTKSAISTVRLMGRPCPEDWTANCEKGSKVASYKTRWNWLRIGDARDAAPTDHGNRR